MSWLDLHGDVLEDVKPSTAFLAVGGGSQPDAGGLGFKTTSSDLHPHEVPVTGVQENISDLKEEMKKLTATNLDLHDQIFLSNQRQCRLAAEAAWAEQEAEKMRAEKTTLTSNNLDLIAQISVLNQQQCGLATKAARTEQEVERLRAEVKKLTATNLDLFAQMYVLKQQQYDLAAKAVRADQEVERMRADHARREVEHVKTEKALQDKVARAEQEVEKMRADRARWEVEQVEAEKVLQDKANSLNAFASSLQMKSNSQLGVLKNIKVELSKFEEQVKSQAQGNMTCNANTSRHGAVDPAGTLGPSTRPKRNAKNAGCYMDHW